MDISVNLNTTILRSVELSNHNQSTWSTASTISDYSSYSEWLWGGFGCLMGLLIVVHSSFGCAFRNNSERFIFPESEFGLEYEAVNTMHELREMHATVKKSTLHLTGFKTLLFNRERPLSMDLARYLGNVFLTIGVCAEMKFPWMTITSALFYIPYDIIYFGLACYLYMIQNGDANERRRRGQYKIAVTYTILAGFPLGSTTKVLLSLWHDRIIYFEMALSPYLLIIGIITLLLQLIICISFIILLCLFYTKSCNEMSLKCCGVLMVMTVVMVILATVLVAIYGIIHKAASINEPGFVKAVIRLLPWVSSMVTTHQPWSVYFLVIWIPASFLITTFVVIACKHGMFLLYLPDYISFWCFILFTGLLCHHLDNPVSTADWIELGVPFYPLIVEILLGVNYYIFTSYTFLQDIDQEIMKRKGKVYLLRIHPGQKLYEEVSSLVHGSWTDENMGKGRDATAQSKCPAQITDIYYLNPDLKLYNHAYRKYVNGRGRVAAKYKNRETPAAIEDQHNNGKVLEPVFTKKIRTTELKKLLKKKLSKKKLNEHYLFHGTKAANVPSICLNGFDMGHSGTRVGSRFGKGVYFAENASKADQYSDEKDSRTVRGLHMFLVRTCLGQSYISNGDVQETGKPQNCDSVCVQREQGLYREFVLFDDDQCYPEFIVVYNKF